jgi:hypothetical protein
MQVLTLGKYATPMGHLENTPIATRKMALGRVPNRGNRLAALLNSTDQQRKKAQPNGLRKFPPKEEDGGIATERPFGLSVTTQLSAKCGRRTSAFGASHPSRGCDLIATLPCPWGKYSIATAKILYFHPKRQRSI